MAYLQTTSLYHQFHHKTKSKWNQSIMPSYKMENNTAITKVTQNLCTTDLLYTFAAASAGAWKCTQISQRSPGIISHCSGVTVNKSGLCGSRLTSSTIEPAFLSWRTMSADCPGCAAKSRLCNHVTNKISNIQIWYVPQKWVVTLTTELHYNTVPSITKSWNAEKIS